MKSTTLLTNFPNLINSLSRVSAGAAPTPEDFANSLHLPVIRFPWSFEDEDTADEDDLVKEGKLWQLLNLAKNRILWVNYSETLETGQFRLLLDWIQENSCILLFKVENNDFIPNGLHLFLKPINQTF